MDSLRKQLDVLMGANRNGDVREVNRKYYDRDVCRLFLVGLCPHELFQLTKMDMGPCPKMHSLQLRKEYEEARAKGLENYDRDLEDVIDRLIVECDRKITRALKRLEDDDAKAAIAISVTEVTQTPEVIELSKQIKEKLKEVDQYDLEGQTDMKIRSLEIVDELRTKRADMQSMLLLDAFNKDRASLPQPLPNPPPLAPLPVVAPDARTQEMINEKLKKAEDLGEQGMVDEAQRALEEAEALKKLASLAPRQEPVLDSSKYTAADVRITDQKLRVCDICGAFLSVYDRIFFSDAILMFYVVSSDRRLADHFGGKLHLGYMQVREKLAELQVVLWICDSGAGINVSVASERFSINMHLGVSVVLSSQLIFQEERNNKRKVLEEERRSKERSKERDREASRDLDKGESRDRGRDYDHRTRDRDRHYDRNLRHDRERDQSRGYDSRNRRRSRSRSNERSRDYDRHRSVHFASARHPQGVMIAIRSRSAAEGIFPKKLACFLGQRENDACFILELEKYYL
ncbi:hypothetical protein RHGRI_027174 [Rhododendron griersonianum]|uniref:RNA-binding protein Luc7-like 2 n=1 Tax=Rhododendron griersonianum TaxID=479676 RepID=A0AAV6IYW2_9ERIC|nr:hypothetical protein RHGRI_027174 [Rhododendron griersonianum]